MPDLDGRPVRAGSLEAVMIAEPCAQPRNLRLRVGLTELAALDEIADVGVDVMTLREKFVGKLEQFPKVAVPSLLARRKS